MAYLKDQTKGRNPASDGDVSRETSAEAEDPVSGGQSETEAQAEAEVTPVEETDGGAVEPD